MRISDCGMRKQTNADCRFWIEELRDLRCAIWNVRFKTEDSSVSYHKFAYLKLWSLRARRAWQSHF